MFTKGPWTVDEGTDSIENMAQCLQENQGTDREWIAVGIRDEDGYAESVAYCHPDNTRLISAAPELYNILFDLVSDLKSDHDVSMYEEGEDERVYHENDCSLCRQLREAEGILKKAGGEE